MRLTAMIVHQNGKCENSCNQRDPGSGVRSAKINTISKIFFLTSAHVNKRPMGLNGHLSIGWDEKHQTKKKTKQILFIIILHYTSSIRQIDCLVISNCEISTYIGKIIISCARVLQFNHYVENGWNVDDKTYFTMIVVKRARSQKMCPI